MCNVKGIKSPLTKSGQAMQMFSRILTCPFCEIDQNYYTSYHLPDISPEILFYLNNAIAIYFL